MSFKQLYSVFLIFLLAQVATAATVDIYFDQSVVSTSSGSQISLSIMGNYGGPAELAGGAINLDFDPQILQLTSSTIDLSTADFGSSSGIVDNVNGQVSGIAFASFWGLTGEFVIADLVFDVIGNGLSSLTMSDAVDPVYQWLNYDYSAGPFGDTVSPVFTGAQISAVPIPAAGWLFASALAGLFLRRKI